MNHFGLEGLGPCGWTSVALLLVTQSGAIAQPDSASSGAQPRPGESVILTLDQISFPKTEARWLLPSTDEDQAGETVPDRIDQSPALDHNPDALRETQALEDREAAFPAPEAEVEITVTGTRTPRPVLRSPANITVLDPEDLQQRLTQDIEDLVRYEPGITVNRDVTYGLTDFNIRGLERNRVLIQLDGIRVPTFFEFGSSLLGRNYLDTEAVGSAEIIRGSASALYGSDALGGVVSFFTPNPSDFLDRTDRDYFMQFEPEYRSAADAFKGTGTLAVQATEELSGLLRYTYRRRQERDINTSDAIADPLTGETHNFLGKLVYDLNEFSDLTLTGEYFRDRGDFDTDPRNLNLVLSFPGIDVRSDTTDTATGRSRISLAYRYDNPESDGPLQFSRVQIYYQGSEYLETRRRQDVLNFGFPVPRDRILENQFVENGVGAEAQFRTDFRTGSVQHQLTYGLDLSNTFNQRLRDGERINRLTGETSKTIGPETFPVKDFPDSETLRIGAYLQDEIEFWDGTLTLIPGLRFDYYRLDAQPDALFLKAPGATASDVSDSAFSPSLGLVYQATPNLALVGRYARGFRAPTYLEINSGFTNILGGYRTAASPDLKPETSHTFEVGVRGEFPKARFGLTGFYSLFDNFIFGAAEGSTAGTEPAGCFPPFRPGCIQVFQSQNLDRVRIYGLEAKGEYRFSGGPDGFKLFAGLSYVVGEDDQNDQPLETINPVEAILGLGYNAPEDRWGAELLTTIVGKARTADNPDEFVPDAYALLDLMGYVKLNDSFSINAGIYNLLDTRYVRYADARRLNDVVTVADPSFGQRRGLITQPGLNFGLGITVSH
ncbi:TonB-dependent hemoglobin/transferrin/lactoferrin family receptor [Lyngbya confervoides]|uniref:TonB-dependent hemoglobin/transferrin/lactoferrin family receptor n=1 Tax=Lyngbya confervoides BDU141951 TaxID=1574623 RepID=A0ABD4T2N1_9CYAN|nr:TonB-dependent hemoglobin/transferrin/lactoferrin family receptor [Lyngbya confervoides]MCM1982914.1 TonB-dependent hemoglobin/transferrin/lactoferrin family receptor [Lyngbya confervoides BDU141951]